METEPGQIRSPFDQPPDFGAATEVAPGILWMRLPLPMALDHVNVYALDDGACGWTIVDTGFHSQKSRLIWETLLAGPLGGRRVHRVLVTHYHPDHIGGAGWLMQQTGAPLVTTRTSYLMARMLVLDVQDSPTPQAIEFWRGAGMDPDLLRERMAQRPFNFADVVAPIPTGYERLAEGQWLTAAGRRWQVRMGEGHAPEHATLWSDDGTLVIGGDQLLPGISANLSVYPTEPMADPVADWIASARRFQPLAGGAELVLPGHKLPFVGLPLRLGQMIDNHVGALERLQAHLGEPRLAADCFPAIFKRPIGPAEYGMALGETVAHLNHLLLAGRAGRSRTDAGAWLWQAADR